ncbi:AMP-binding protein [Pseudosulfitobacter pseudonitzschiae]|uniref:AMP-binding protein n=1 Tax=Pseudosulfitobacter pseudonitzschiae TaxID=1402135 RepID=UPI0021E51882|nr:AMP-binding protein [Pseudosulfitobacter pseudonitzschiae]
MIGSGSCGIAAPFRETKIVDDAGREVPTGEVGELLVRGPGMAAGYFDNPKASAELLAGAGCTPAICSARMRRAITTS